MRKLKSVGILILLIFFAAAMGGCASFDKRATQILDSTLAAQDAGGHSIAYLYHNKKISEDTWLKFKETNDKFVAVHTEGVNAMIKYRATKTPGDQNNVDVILEKLLLLAKTVSNVVSELTNKVEVQ